MLPFSLLALFGATELESWLLLDKGAIYLDSEYWRLLTVALVLLWRQRPPMSLWLRLQPWHLLRRSLLLLQLWRQRPLMSLLRKRRSRHLLRRCRLLLPHFGPHPTATGQLKISGRPQ